MTIRTLLRDQRGSAMVMFPAFILVAAGIASLAAGFLIVDYGYWATFALAGATRMASALILLIAFGGRKAEKPSSG